MIKILTVDDEPSILRILHAILSSNIYKVDSALGGEQAIEKLSNESYDIMITDIRMNPMNGMDVLKFANENFPTMSVIMLTAYGNVDTAVEALQLGAFDYIHKPFKPDELLSTVKRALECRDYMQKSAFME
jgi:DNA-binding NtrC family response regulator